MNCWFSFFSNALLSPVSALCSHFCLCGAGRRCLQSWRSTFLVVVHRGQNRFWTCAQGLMSPLHLALFLCRCPVKRTCCHWYKLQRKRTGGCTRYMSCKEFPSKCCSFLVPQRRNGWYHSISRMDYFYGLPADEVLWNGAENSFLHGNIILSYLPVHCCWVGFYLSDSSSSKEIRKQMFLLRGLCLLLTEKPYNQCVTYVTQT